MMAEITIVKRDTCFVRDKSTCLSWKVEMDYIDNKKSEFWVNRKIDAKRGDFVLVSLENGQNSYMSENGIFRPFYVGLVDTLEQTDETWKLFALSLINLLYFDFPATPQSGSDVGKHMLALLKRYFLNDESKLSQGVLVKNVLPAINHSYQPSNPPAVTKLTDYFINIFKKYCVVWEVEGIRYDSDGKLLIETVIKSSDKSLNAKSNVDDFSDWDILISPAHQAVENELMIVAKTTADSEQPLVLATWYMNRDGDITQDLEEVSLPTRAKVYIYGQDEESTFEQVAQSELSSSRYSHEISFSIHKESRLVKFSDLEIGMQATLYIEEVGHPSVLTGISLASDSPYIRLTFGNVRSSLQQLVN